MKRRRNTAPAQASASIVPIPASTYDPAAKVLTLYMPVPDRRLSPNCVVGSLGGRMAKSTAAKKCRNDANYRAQAAQGEHRPLCWPAAEVAVTFFFKTAQSRDKDNLLAMLKHAFDGLADAGVVLNDRDFTYLPVQIDKDPACPRVRITLTRKDKTP